MKHILLATTALVATAGAASAEIALSGMGEMGIIGGSGYDNADIETQFHTDVDVTFTMTGETDNGLTFGAKVDLDEGAAFGNTTQGGETLFIAYGPAKLTMGDVDGAFDAAMQEAIIGSAINDDHEHAGYYGNSGLDGNYDGQIAQFSYAASGFTGYLSVELDDTGTFDPIWGLGVSYNAELAGLDLTVGLGYQSGDQDNADAAGIAAVAAAGAAPTFATAVAAAAGAAEMSDIWGLSVGTTLNNGVQVIANYSSANYSDVAGTNDETETNFGLAFGYSMNALTIGVNYGKSDNFLGFDELEAKGFGLAVDYDLGGGAEVQFGYGKSEISAPGFSDEADSFSLGIAMSF
ncbi:porin [Tropicibacter sp. R15_0]|uniref:porin n=1 Tax=Tropicibacter sp. R15_0 TaxID=2821101 RepID=UPI001ADACC4B|nr:porin [Tropicibacter sp. R15_0]MBO9466897.1 porin [Tropicibacter sp. R15_0]